MQHGSVWIGSQSPFEGVFRLWLVEVPCQQQALHTISAHKFMSIKNTFKLNQPNLSGLQKKIASTSISYRPAVLTVVLSISECPACTALGATLRKIGCEQTLLQTLLGHDAFPMMPSRGGGGLYLVKELLGLGGAGLNFVVEAMEVIEYFQPLLCVWPRCAAPIREFWLCST